MAAFNNTFPHTGDVHAQVISRFSHRALLIPEDVAVRLEVVNEGKHNGNVMKKRDFIYFVILFVMMLLFTSCTATQPPVSLDGNAPGFWFGLWHGFIAPITFIVSLLSDIRIYAYPNAGLWYDFGFMLGISGFSGGIFAGSRRRRRD
jgi:hypothetical protein